ncbi:helix-turn-helix domain-containing protein [Microvirga terricola]|uniref:Transcriptional regulator n=1 Tax=Microvirga terricola TaxID=2719797 RepID=A0ABX0VAJ6_9HYPH|nr:transcriptional regulator [Microvirga terricola]
MVRATDWHREKVKYEVRTKGLSLSDLARQFGYTDSAVRKALGRPWPAVERIIADFIGQEPRNIWPSRYHDDGTPRSTGSSRDHTRRRRRRHRQKTT